jgi:hypothetical protein
VLLDRTTVVKASSLEENVERDSLVGGAGVENKTKVSLRRCW